MILVTWNVNGLRSLIREYKTLENLFKTLQADIICFQESRIGVDDINIGCIPDGYDAFLSSCKYNKGYAGVITYTRLSILPTHAYTSLKDLLSSHLLSNKDAIYNKYDTTFLEEANDEGRIVVIEYDSSLIMNVYFPANTDEERCSFRREFYYLIKDILTQIDRSVYTVFLVGDFNTACGIIDSAYLESDKEKNGYIEQFRSMSEWLECLLSPLSENGCDLIDTFRYLHPTERNVYTCFCNQFGGRQTNFGSRIDYILCESKLKSLVKSASVLTTMKGSDHLPVITELDYSLHSSQPCQGLRTLVQSQHRIDQFFTKQEKEVKSTVKRETPSVKETENEWLCSRCTLINPVTSTYCEACGTKRQKQKQTLVEVGIDSLFGKKRKVLVPLCSGHHLPCIRHQVQKEGKNKGRFFYISFFSIMFGRSSSYTLVLFPLGLRIIPNPDVITLFGRMLYNRFSCFSIVFYESFLLLC